MADLQVKTFKELSDDEKKEYGAVIAGSGPEFIIWVGKTQETLRGFPITEDMIPLHVINNVIEYIKKATGGNLEKLMDYYDPAFIAETIGGILKIHYPEDIKTAKSLTQLMTPAQVKEGLFLIYNAIFSGSKLAKGTKDFFSKLTPLMTILSQPGGEQMVQIFPALLQDLSDRVMKVEEKVSKL